MKKTLLSLVLTTITLCNYTQSVTTLAGSGMPGFDNGQGIAATFQNPHDVAIDASGNLFVADYYNSVIRKITPSGLVSTYAGTGNAGSNDGTLANASFSHPTGLCFDSNGNMYIADYGNKLIRKIDVNGNVTTLAGSGASSSTDGNGVSASFNGPLGICMGSNNKIYVSEQIGHKIRTIDANANVTTLAGTGGQGSSNIQGAVTFYYPYHICFDASNEYLYVADQGNHLIRRIEISDTTVTTFAGTGNAGSVDGTLTTASFSTPLAIAINSNGDLLIADYGNHKIRKINIGSGMVSTYAGSGTPGNVDNTGNTAEFNNPIGLAMGANNIVYVTDYSNHSVRKIEPGASFITENNDFEINLYPNPTSDKLSVLTSKNLQSIKIYNMTGELIQIENRNEFSVASLPKGIYIAFISTDNGISKAKFIKE